MAQLPVRSPQGTRTIEVLGGESLFDIASKYLGDAWQWWRIFDLNAEPGTPPDFIVQAAGTLMLPAPNPDMPDNPAIG